MADKFLFSNFAISTLTQPVAPSDTILRLNTDDVGRFPSLLPGTKFPLIIADDDNHVEIVYVTQLLSSGVATVERGREGTLAQSWLAGTLLRHTFTASTIIGAAGFALKGAYAAGTDYVYGDLVTYGGLSFVATGTSLGQTPFSGSAYWQVLYEPPGTASSALNWQGLWNNTTTYAAGQVVRWNGRIWKSSANNINSTPAPGNADWEALAPWAGGAHFESAVIFSGVNNTSVTMATAIAPVQLYDGLTIRGRFSDANSGNVTIQINALAAIPARPKSGTDFLANAIVVGEMYEFTYVSATGEFIALSTPGIGATVAALQAAVAGAAAGLVPIGTVVDYAGSVAPTNWLLCQGQQVSKAAYPDLWAAVGTIFGVDTSTTFALPDCRGRVRVSADAGVGRISTATMSAPTPGGTGGEEAHALSTAEMPVHSHGVTDPGHGHGVNDPGHSHSYTSSNNSGSTAAGPGSAPIYVGAGATTSPANANVTIQAAATNIAVQNAGSGNAHTNMPPAIVINSIIRAL